MRTPYVVNAWRFARRWHNRREAFITWLYCLYYRVRWHEEF